MPKGLYGTEKATWKGWEWVVSKSFSDEMTLNLACKTELV